MFNAIACAAYMAIGCFLYQLLFAKNPDFHKAFEQAFLQTVAIFVYYFIWADK